MHFVEKSPAEKKSEFAKKLKSGKLLRFPGAYNPLVAKLIEQIGYDGIYVSGGVMANDLGFPDIGLTTLNDVANRSHQIARVTNLPTIIDIDTGFGEAMKDESEFERMRKELSCYLLANMTEFGKSKLLTKEELENLGYNLVIYPVTTQRLAMKNVEDGLRQIFEEGHQNNVIDKMQTRKRLYEIVDYEKYGEFDQSIFNFSQKGHD